MRCATYGRKSDDNPESVEGQLEAARTYAETHGWTVVREFSDSGVSGGEFVDRAGFNALMDAVQAKHREFDVLVMRDVDRLGRDQFRTALALQDITEHGVRVFTYADDTELKLESFADKMMLSIKTGSGEDFKAKISKNVRLKFAEKVRKGHATGAKVFGYDWVRRGIKGEPGSYVERQVNREQAKTVTRIFELAASGYGNRRIMTTLIKESVPAPTTRGWSKGGVKAILNRDAYLGRIVFGKTRNAAKGGRAEIRVAVDPQHWIIVERPELQIITPELWAAAQKRRDKTRAHFVRRDNGQLLGRPESGLIARYLMNGIGRCFECGGPLQFISKGTDRRRRLKYYCRHHRDTGSCKNGLGVPMRSLDTAVRLRLHEMLLHDEEVHWALITERAAQFRRDTAQPAEVRDNTVKELARLEGEVERLIGALAGGKESPRVLAEIQKREVAIDGLKGKLVAVPEFKVDRAELHRARLAYIGHLADGDAPSVRTVLRRFRIERVVVVPDGDSWRFEGPADLAGLLGSGYSGDRGERRPLPPMFN